MLSSAVSDRAFNAEPFQHSDIRYESMKWTGTTSSKMHADAFVHDLFASTKALLRYSQEMGGRKSEIADFSLLVLA